MQHWWTTLVGAFEVTYVSKAKLLTLQPYMYIIDLRAVIMIETSYCMRFTNEKYFNLM